MKEEKISGAEALLRSLSAEGVDTVFGYPGGAILPVYDALYGYPSLRHILVRHEQGAVHAAQGYARASGKTGVVIVTSGPGAANCVTGLADALADSTPVVVITGQVGAQYLGSDAFQETDVVAVTQPITKWAVQVRRAEDVAAAVAKAFYIAASGRPGPVVVDLAKDAQVGLTDFAYRPMSFIRSYNPTPHASPQAVADAARLINAARRPLVIGGHGVEISGAGLLLRAMAEKGRLPVAQTLMGLSSLTFDHPLNIGMAGMHGTLAANHAALRADLVVGIGMRFDDRVTGLTCGFAPEAKIVHIDIDASEFNKTVAADVALHADASEALGLLLPAIEAPVGDGLSERQRWLDELDRCRQVERREVEEAELHRPDSQPLTMGRVALEVGLQTPPRTIAVTDVGQNQMMTARYFPHRSPLGFITSGGIGTMGFGLPAAIGAAVASQQRPVVCFLGDGGLQMTLQELGTVMQFQVPVKIVLLDNAFLGNVKQWQTLFFGHRYSQTPMHNPRFSLLAQAYGLPYAEASDTASLRQGIAQMMATDGPFFLHVAIDPDDMVFPMIPGGHSADMIMLNPEKTFDHNGVANP